MTEASLSLEKALPGGLRPYRAIDYLTQGYLLLVALMVLLFHGDRVPGWPWYVGAHLAAVAAVHGLLLAQQRRGGRVLDFLRAFYPIILYTFLYTETHKLMHMFVPGYLDAHAIAADQALFGCQPSRVLMQAAAPLVGQRAALPGLLLLLLDGLRRRPRALRLEAGALPALRHGGQLRLLRLLPHLHHPARAGACTTRP